MEAVLRSEFHSRLRLMFPDQGDETWINHYGEGTEARTIVGLAQGRVANRFIDNLVGSTTIEYESDLRIAAKREEGFSQVRDHVAGLIRSGVPISQIRGVLSDTVDWHAYDAELPPGINPATCTGDDVTLLPIDELTLTDNDEPSAVRLIAFLRKHLAREQSRFPKAALLALDLGLDSVSYERSAGPLRQLVDDGRAVDPSILLATDLWSRFVDYLEGEEGGFRAAAYVDEVYVCFLARLLSANVLTGHAISSSDSELKSILDGSYFQHRYFLANMVEQDYFGWLTDPTCIDRLVPIARQIQQDLYAYDFSWRPEEDLFGRLMAQLAVAASASCWAKNGRPPGLAACLSNDVLITYRRGRSHVSSICAAALAPSYPRSSRWRKRASASTISLLCTAWLLGSILTRWQSACLRQPGLSLSSTRSRRRPHLSSSPSITPTRSFP